jgi:hypothetical protein
MDKLSLIKYPACKLNWGIEKSDGLKYVSNPSKVVGASEAVTLFNVKSYPGP